MDPPEKSYSETYPYHVVEFISRGRKPKNRRTDIVLTKWIQSVKDKKKGVVLYPAPPYTEDSFDQYNNLLLSLEDPLVEWVEFTVKIIGRASEWSTIKI